MYIITASGRMHMGIPFPFLHSRCGRERPFTFTVTVNR